MLHKHMDINPFGIFSRRSEMFSFIGKSITGYLDFVKMSCFGHWNRWYFLVPIFGVFYSFAVLSPWYISGYLVTRVRLINGRLEKSVNQVSWFFYFLENFLFEVALSTHAAVNPIFATFYFMLILLIGVWTTVKLEEKGKKSHSSQHRHFVRKLTRVIACNSFLMSGNLILLFVMSVAYIFYIPLLILEIQSIVVTFTSDMVTLAMPYILFAFDSNIRRLLRIEKTPDIARQFNSCSGRTISNYAIN
ncbi:hypothetical protein CRE_04891 [Caenorhabditis remanei]|uniref:Serpentine receptor class gamma n=1 Tax=Caenorhabditis remanei TaxID=31234 RepID=E3MN66_CAERE|nr:hypothetical protein CRE_04891 [Caenorhabditis remanei]